MNEVYQIYKELESTKEQVKFLQKQVTFLSRWIYEVAYPQAPMSAQESFKDFNSLTKRVDDE